MLKSDPSDPSVPRHDPSLPKMGDGYRMWLIYAAIHLGVVRCKGDPTEGFTLAEVRRDLYELDALEGVDRVGDAWLAMVLVYGPFDRMAKSLDAYILRHAAFTAKDFPLHWPPPPKTAASWSPPGGAKPLVGPTPSRSAAPESEPADKPKRARRPRRA